MNKKIPIIVFIATILAMFQIIILPYVPAHAEEDESECWAVIIGISDYRGIEDLRGCAEDAEELFNILSPVWGEEHVKLLLDDEATRSGIQRSITWLASNADTNDTALIYFSGYGSRTGAYIAPQNAKYRHTWISARELRDWLQGLKSERTVIILDTSHANYMGEKLNDRGRVILASSRADEESWSCTVGGEPHGLFSYYILCALTEFNITDTNRNYELSAEELFNYVEPATVSATNEWPTQQHPVLSDNYSGELSLLTKYLFNIKPYVLSGTDNILSIDDEEYTITPVEIICAPGSLHDISVLPLVDTGKGIRYVFTSWNDGDTSDNITLTHGGKYTANYKTQYEFIIESAYGEPGGQGWYDESSTATISVQSIEKPRTKHTFTGWSGDYFGTEATALVDVDSPMTIKANWQTQYFLTIESTYGGPSGQGWYDEGSAANIAVIPSEGLLVRQVFTGWGGDYSGIEATALLNMNSPMAIKANWRTDYTYLYIAIAGLAVLVATIIIIVVLIHRKKRAI